MSLRACVHLAATVVEGMTEEDVAMKMDMMMMKRAGREGSGRCATSENDRYPCAIDYEGNVHHRGFGASAF